MACPNLWHELLRCGTMAVLDCHARQTPVAHINRHEGCEKFHPLECSVAELDCLPTLLSPSLSDSPKRKNKQKLPSYSCRSAGPWPTHASKPHTQPEPSVKLKDSWLQLAQPRSIKDPTLQSSRLRLLSYV